MEIGVVRLNPGKNVSQFHSHLVSEFQHHPKFLASKLSIQKMRVTAFAIS